MIRHLAMNMTQNLNPPPSKWGVWAHYSLCMLISHRNWDYNKHLQVEFGTYVQASQANDPKNKNRPRTLDGIYLCPAPNFQYGHQIMDLCTGQVITLPKLVQIPKKDIVINTVKNGGGSGI